MDMSEDASFDQGMNSHDSVDKEIKEEPSSSSDDDEEPNKLESQGAFLCEICHSSNIDSCAKFKEQSHLVLHTYKNHPTACIGCFEAFDTLEDLVKHLKRIEHNLPMCRECWKLVPDESHLIGHECTGLRFTEIDRKANRSNIDEVETDTSDEENDRESIDGSTEDENIETEDDDDDYESSAETSVGENGASDMEITELTSGHCEKSGFTNPVELGLHTHESHSHVCIVCSKGFDDEESLGKHREVMGHHVWTCERCDKHFIARGQFRRHVTVNHPKDCPMKCPDCDDFRGFTQVDIYRHQRKIHGKMLHPLSELQMKLRSKWRIMETKCNICLKEYLTSYSLLLHMFQEHNEAGQTHVYECDKCQIGFGRGRSLEIHVKEFHSDEQTFMESSKSLIESLLKPPSNCDSCGKEYADLHQHISRVHPQLRPYKCTICGKGHYEKSDIPVHLHACHDGPSPFACPVCDRVSKNVNSLAVHLKKIHNYDEMPNSYCFIHKLALPNGAVLRKHLRKFHSDTLQIKFEAKPKVCCKVNRSKESPDRNGVTQQTWECDLCEAKYKTKRTLDRHKNKHSSVYMCTTCCKNFDSSYTLREHQVVHSKNESFQCKICSIRMRQRNSLRRHIKRFHPTINITSEDLKPLPQVHDKATPTDKHQKSDSKKAVSNSLSVNADQDHIMAGVKREPESEDDIESTDSTSESEGTISGEDDDCEAGTSNEKLSCIHCSWDDFCDQKVLRLHTMTVHPTVCLICFEGFDNEENLRNHQKAMKHDTWTCSSCNKYFIRRSLYRKHLARNHPEKCPLRCPDCKEFGSFYRLSLKKHRQTAHGETLTSQIDKEKAKPDWKISSLVCDICLKSFMTSYSYGLHMLKEHDEPGQTHVYKCELCEFGFGRGRAFEMHVKVFHSDDTDYVESVKQVLESTLKIPTKCDICKRETDGRSSHIRRFHPHLRTHKCHICGLGFIEESDIKVHIHHDHNGPLPFVCPICDLTCKTFEAFRGHLKKKHKHKGMPVCYCFKHERGFHSTYLMTQHLNNTHPEITNITKPTVSKYPCPDCNKEFTAAALKIHIMQVHTKREAKYKCDQCGKSYRDKSSLNIHKNVHTDNFRCADCGRTFQTQHAVDRHRVVHSKERPFKCEICGLGVSQRSALQRHVKVVHPNGKLKEGYKPYSRKSRAPKSKAEKETVTNGYDKQDMEAKMNKASRDDTTLTNEVKRNLRKRTVQYKEDSASSSDESYRPKKQSCGSSRPRKKRKVGQDDEWQASDDEHLLVNDSEEESGD